MNLPEQDDYVEILKLLPAWVKTPPSFVPGTMARALCEAVWVVAQQKLREESAEAPALYEVMELLEDIGNTVPEGALPEGCTLSAIPEKCIVMQYAEPQQFERLTKVAEGLKELLEIDIPFIVVEDSVKFMRLREVKVEPGPPQYEGDVDALIKSLET